MSLASVYAAAQVIAADEQAVVTASVPAAFIGANGRAEVTPKGGLHLIQTTSGDFEITAQAALAFATWINATFGEV